MKKISVFKSLFKSKETPFNLNPAEVVARIRLGTEELREKINLIRSVDKKDPRYSASKKELNAIMFNGTFSERTAKGLIEHSGLCVLDFDGYPSTEIMQAERERLIKDLIDKTNSSIESVTLESFEDMNEDELRSLILIGNGRVRHAYRPETLYYQYVAIYYFVYIKSAKLT